MATYYYNMYKAPDYLPHFGGFGHTKLSSAIAAIGDEPSPHIGVLEVATRAGKVSVRVVQKRKGKKK
jgi:hypothetical protein